MPIGDGQVMGRIRSFLTEPTFGNVAGMTPEDVARRRALAQALWSEGNNSEPVTSIFGGMNKMLQSFLGGRQLWKAENTDIAVRDRADQQQQAGLQQMAEFAYPGQQSPSTAPAPSPAPLLGAVAGAAAGNAIERLSTKEEAVEVIVQLSNGDRRAIVQAKGGETLLAGDKVVIVTSGGKVRVSRAPK